MPVAPIEIDFVLRSPSTSLVVFTLSSFGLPFFKLALLPGQTAPDGGDVDRERNASESAALDEGTSLEQIYMDIVLL